MNMLMLIFGVFALIGAFDTIIGNKIGIGKEFEKGINSFGPLALSMVGLICISPVLARILIPFLSLLSDFFGFDPSVLVGSILANDMGGASLAVEVSKEPFWGYYNGLIVGGTLGVTVSFTIPVALKTIDKIYHKEALLGILCGICTIPLGCFASLIFLKASIISSLINLAPVFIISILVAIGIIKFSDFIIKILSGFGKVISCIIVFGLSISIFQALTSIEIIKGMLPINEAFITVSGICIVLSGVFPLVFFLKILLEKPLIMLSDKIGINQVSCIGLITSLANSIPVFSTLDKMDKRGRVLNMAFAVSASFSFGDHLAFCTAFNSEYTTAMILGKLTAGISSLIVASIITRNINNNKP